MYVYKIIIHVHRLYVRTIILLSPVSKPRGDSNVLKLMGVGDLNFTS
jgi:hypothetical protein